MTERKQTQSSGRREQGGGLAWKSGLLASSVGGLLLGWALLGQANPVPAGKVAQIASPQPRVIVVQIPIPAAASNGNQQLVSQPAQPAQASAQVAPPPPAQANQQAAPAQSAPAPASPQIFMPSMPQKPVFQQPVTSTRGS